MLGGYQKRNEEKTGTKQLLGTLISLNNI